MAKTKLLADEYFSFEHSGTTYVLPLKTKEVMNPGWVRMNRRRDETDYFMSLLEGLCGMGDDQELPEEWDDDARDQGNDIMDLLDHMTWSEHKKVQEALGKHLDATLGE